MRLWIGLAITAYLAGCGGRTELGSHGADASIATPDASWTVCGDAAPCDPGTEYCKHVIGGPPPGVNTYNCEALTSNCHSCDCVIQVACTCVDDTGHITLTCDVP